MSDRKLLIIGAGPKAMAIAAKATVLAQLGFSVPEVHIVERAAVGAHWTGRSGYTNGRQPLGTSPEKDIGFPYDSCAWGRDTGRAIDREMLRFSWQSFLIATDGYSDWVDRGRPAPEHRVWARYLDWVSRQLAPTVHLHAGEVTAVRLTGERWRVQVDRGGASRHLTADGLVLTGPGRVAPPAGVPEHPHVLTVETFWRDADRLWALEQGHVAIVGTGETAAAIATELATRGQPGLTIEIVSPVGMAYTRGESFRENRVYSDPTRGHWTMLTPEHRRDFIRRTDRGVFSQDASRVLDATGPVDIVPGKLTRVTIPADGRPLLELEYDSVRFRRSCDRVILATGGDPLGFLEKLLDDATRASVVTRASLTALSREDVEATIGFDLGVAGLAPRLHLPMLAGLTQGPGFANLSCLGRLADRILEPYTRRGGNARTDAREECHEVRIHHS